MWPQPLHFHNNQQHDKLHNQNHHHHHHHVPSIGITPHSKPQQRQRWGETDGHPVISWGELFFDLFFVAGAYNLASILKEDTTAEGLLYFVGCFGGILQIWNRKLMYDAAFAVTTDDLWHTTHRTMQYIVLGTAVLHIRPVGLMAQPKNSVEMFCYSLALLLDALLVAIQYGEVYKYGEGGPELKLTAVRELKKNALVVAFYLAATTVAGVEFYIRGDGSLQENVSEAVTVYQHENSEIEPNYIPIILILCGWLSYGGVILYDAFILYASEREVHKVTVPFNVEYIIHRQGELVMVLLGESVLSLLIVQISYGTDYYLSFYCGLLSVVGFQSLHYRSQPHHAEEHAMRRSTKAGTLFLLLMQSYSMALVALGASYKLLLTEHIYDDGYTDHYLYGSSRRLGGEELPMAERRQRIAVLFTASLTVAFAVLDAMILCHKGIRENWNRLKSRKGVVVTLIRIALLLFCASFSFYVSEPEILSIAGLLAIALQIVFRVAGTLVFSMDRIEAEKNKTNGYDEEESHNSGSNLIFSIFYSPLYHGKDAAD